MGNTLPFPTIDWLHPTAAMTAAQQQGSAPQPPAGQTPSATGLTHDPLQGWGDLASVAGAAGSGAKADRALQGQFTQNYDRLMLDAQQENRANESDALNKLAVSKYLTGGGSHYTPPTFSINGKDYAPGDMGMGPTPASEAQMQGAKTLQDQMLKRLAPGGGYTPTNLDSYAKPGSVEKATNVISPIIGGIGAIDKLGGGAITNWLKKHFGGKSTQAGAAPSTSGVGTTAATGGIGSTVGQAFDSNGAFNPYGIAGHVGDALSPSMAAAAASTAVPLAATGAGSLASNAYNAGMFTGPSGVATPAAGHLASGASGAGGTMSTLMGKVVPAAGAAYGAYELGKNKSKSSDIMSGASSGAGIGTMVMPGVGTAVGAGIGALVGLGRHAFGGPDQVEKAARAASGDFLSKLTAGATPDEQAQAQHAGWHDPNQALAMITLRDKLQAQGKDPNQAGVLMQQLLDATSHAKNPKAVAAATAAIQQALG